MSEYYPGFYVGDYKKDLVLYGLSGVAGSGKNYMAIHAFVPSGYVPIALANPLKIEGVAEAGLPYGEVFGSDKSKSTRHWLQQRGTEQGRDVHGEDIWCKYIELWMLFWLRHNIFRFVITDVRFPNEIDWVHKLGGKVIRLIGRGGLSGAHAKHRSESMVSDEDDYWDFVINNSPDVSGAVHEVRHIARVQA